MVVKLQLSLWCQFNNSSMKVWKVKEIIKYLNKAMLLKKTRKEI